MAQYAIAFDLNTRAMRAAGMTKGQIVHVYQHEIPDALQAAGFPAHPQGSLYHTVAEHDPILAIMQLQGALQNEAPNFCQYVRRVHVFRMDEWSDVTALISVHGPGGAPNSVPAPAPVAAPGVPDPEEELEEQELSSAEVGDE